MEIGQVNILGKIGDIKNIGDNKMDTLRGVKTGLQNEVQQIRAQIEQLRKTREQLNQNLHITRDKITAVGLREYEERRDNQKEELKQIETNSQNLDCQLMTFGIQMQKDIRSLVDRTAQTHLEYRSTDCLQNGVKTQIFKAEEGRTLIIEAEKIRLPLQEQLKKAKETELIDLEKAMIILSGSEQVLAAKTKSVETVKQEIKRLGATPMTD